MPGVPVYRLRWPERGRPLAVRRVLIERWRPRRFDPDEWHGCLVVVERGGLELEWRDGARLAFSPGDLLCLQGLALSRLFSTTPAPTVLLVMRR